MIEFLITFRSLRGIYMYLKHFGKQVSLRMLSYLLANVFLEEIPSEIQLSYFHVFIFSGEYVFIVCFMYNVLLYHFVSFLYHSYEIKSTGCM